MYRCAQQVFPGRREREPQTSPKGAKYAVSPIKSAYIGCGGHYLAGEGHRRGIARHPDPARNVSDGSLAASAMSARDLTAAAITERYMQIAASLHGDGRYVSPAAPPPGGIGESQPGARLMKDTQCVCPIMFTHMYCMISITRGLAGSPPRSASTPTTIIR